MRSRRFTQVDVFAAAPFRGNPVAVVADADGLTDAQMQAFAAWTNLSETTFLLPPTGPFADYRVRIFTARKELPFAGHPTLGSAHAWLQAGGRPQHEELVYQECAAGLVTVAVQEGRLFFAAPPMTRFEGVSEPVLVAVTDALRLDRRAVLDASWLVNGPEWVGVRLNSAAAVLALNPDPASLQQYAIGVVGPHPPGHDASFEVRAFLGGDPVWEDPVTGSLNAGLGHWLISSGRAPTTYIAAQGTRVGRTGRVHVRQDKKTLWVGGAVTTATTGTVRL